MVITFYDSYNILNKVYSEKAFVKQALLDVQIRESTRAQTTKICYGVLDKDITLEYIISKLCQKMPKQKIKVMLKIGLYSIIYLKTPPHIVTDACVELIKKLGKGGTSGFVNAVLRNYLRNGVNLEEKGNFGLSIKYSYPLFAINELIKDYGLEKAEKIMQEDTSRTYLTFNTGVNGEEYLKNLNKEYQKTPFENCFEVKNFKMNEDFYDGIYTFQSIGSVAICSVVESGNNLLDACSAPGGKAVLLSNKFNSVTALELHEHRTELIKSYAKRMKKDNVTAINADSTVYNGDYDSLFDAVLCDAPCSGLGVIKDNPDIKLNRDLNSITKLTKIQLKLLNNVCKYVKVGGYLYYSTCSILKRENVEIAKKFLKENSNFIAEDFDCLLNNEKQEEGLQFLPHISSGAGFYVAKFKRIK